MEDAQHIFTATQGSIKVELDGVAHKAQKVRVLTDASVKVEAGLLANVPKPYMSEIAQVLLYGAPQYKVNDQGQTIYVPTGEVVPSVAPSLKSRYKDVTALLNDISAQNYTRRVVVDGKTLEYTQYGSDPAAYFGSEVGTGDLIELEVPAIPPTNPILTVSGTGATPTVFQIRRNGRVNLEGFAGVAYVAQESAKGMKDGFGHFSLSEVPGSPTVARTREIAGDGKIIEARGLPSVSSDVTYQVKNERFVTVNDAPQDVGALEVSWIGDQSAAFFVESHPPK